MAFYLRKAFSFGPIRANLSKSGIGVSGGVTGARVGVRPDGRSYVHAGRHGLYYRKEVGNITKEKKSERDTKSAQEDGYNDDFDITPLIITTGVILLLIFIIIGFLGVRKDIKSANEVKEPQVNISESIPASNKQSTHEIIYYNNPSKPNKDGLSDYEIFMRQNELKNTVEKQVSDLKEELPEEKKVKESTIKAVIDDGILYMIKCTYTNEADFILGFLEAEAQIEKAVDKGIIKGNFKNTFDWYIIG